MYRSGVYYDSDSEIYFIRCNISMYNIELVRLYRWLEGETPGYVELVRGFSQNRWAGQCYT